MLYKALISIVAFLAITFTTQAQSDKDLDAFTVQVEGLGCPFCAYGLEKKFKELKGLKKPVIDMETGKFTFLFPAKEALSISRVEKQVEAAGYTAVRVQIERANGNTEDSEQATTAATTAATQSATLQVAGNCGMCKARIEKAAKGVEGVTEATWNAQKQSLQVTYQPSKTDKASIAQRVAQSGHDTQLKKAKDSTYDKLPPCCLYDRL